MKPTKSVPRDVADIATARDLVASMGANASKGGIAKLPYAVRFRLFRRDTPLGALQLETVMNAPHLQLLRMEPMDIGILKFYEVWFADLTATVDGYDHSTVGDLLEKREVPSPVAAILDPVGNRVYPASYDTPFDAMVEYDNNMVESAPPAQAAKPPKRKVNRAVVRRDVSSAD